MTKDEVKNALLQVLDRVQSLSGCSSPALKGSDVPGKVLESFDSTVWPVATGWLAKKLDIIIPNDVHIFGTLDGKTLLTIDESVNLVLAKKQNKPPITVAAE
uniref:hypothetical protein n=1 Tax=uncultured Rhizobium sp. TaxID=155567 RepID=UPI002628F7CC|nr:hypothetical protein [uncultured Rhizobium sp.]